MKSAWRVLHDPLRLAENVGTLTTFEKEAQSRGEDLMQWERITSQKKQVLDLGWYHDRYLVLLVDDEDWSSPRRKIECRDLSSAMDALRRLAV